MSDLEAFLVQLVWLAALRDLRAASRRGVKSVWFHFWDLHVQLGCPPMPYNAGAFI